jgi:hypothetical protein
MSMRGLEQLQRVEQGAGDERAHDVAVKEVALQGGEPGRPVHRQIGRGDAAAGHRGHQVDLAGQRDAAAGRGDGRRGHRLHDPVGERRGARAAAGEGQHHGGLVDGLGRLGLERCVAVAGALVDMPELGRADRRSAGGKPEQREGRRRTGVKVTMTGSSWPLPGGGSIVATLRQAGRSPTSSVSKVCCPLSVASGCPTKPATST